MLLLIQDKQEGAQWFAAPATIRNIIEACLSRVSSLKGQALIIQHMTMYDGVFEKVGAFDTNTKHKHVNYVFLLMLFSSS